ncbi:hypothetical protein [Nitrosomonas sp. Nm33]|uniref:hypothetical protein n=1 Tax=Nitrosomonas sp. Nm33 TaxID=133724 RepID=UPI00089809C5|nr:hypothetical protein [Nitrosomonas sp. Nm33]SDZ15343.1 hypothetical protein SAMN05421755_11394 [Nitrosomonas sp. Nm33]
MFLENPLFFDLARVGLKKGELRLPFGKAKSSPIASSDVARAMSTILMNPEKHIGKIYELTGAHSENMMELAQEYSEALHRPVKYVDVPMETWKKDVLKEIGLPPHVEAHISSMAELHAQNRYDRYTEDFKQITGKNPMSVTEWVRENLQV